MIGPYKIGQGRNETTLYCLTMIDPATGWFEIAEVPTRRADNIVNILEFSWLTCYPWPTEIIMDRGKEFQAEVSDIYASGRTDVPDHAAAATSTTDP